MRNSPKTDAQPKFQSSHKNKIWILTITFLLAAGLAPAAELGRDESYDPRRDNAALYKDRFIGEDPFGLSFEQSGEPAQPSVNMSEEFVFGEGPRKNIDSFLGHYDNPFAPAESTYDGSRSEMRQEKKRLRDQ